MCVCVCVCGGGENTSTDPPTIVLQLDMLVQHSMMFDQRCLTILATDAVRTADPIHKQATPFTLSGAPGAEIKFNSVVSIDACVTTLRTEFIATSSLEFDIILSK